MVAVALSPNNLQSTTQGPSTNHHTLPQMYTLPNTSSPSFITASPNTSNAPYITQPSQFPTIAFPYPPWTAMQSPPQLFTSSTSNSQSPNQSSESQFLYPTQLLHPPYYFYPHNTFMTLPAGNYVNTSASSEVDEEEILSEDDNDDNNKRKRDQHESYDDTSNILFQKKLKDK